VIADLLATFDERDTVIGKRLWDNRERAAAAYSASAL
jgi:hypothetical protein